MQLTRTQGWLLVAVLVTAILAWRAPALQNDTDIAMPTRLVSTGANTNSNAQSQAGILASLPPRQSMPMTANIFDVPLKPPAHKQSNQKVVIEKPMAPPLPFSFVGHMQTNDKNSIMLNYQGDLIEVKQGETIDGQYRVQSILQTPTSLQITFLMIPLNQQQTMQIGLSP